MGERSDTSVCLVRVTRSGATDAVHRGSVVVVDDAGRLVAAWGDPEAAGYLRSAAKPLQCLPVLTSGAAEAFGFDDRDIAIICGSHHGGPEQVAQVRSILAKAGLSEALLQSGTGIADNCSGKHAGMLAACRHLGYSLHDYTAPAHPYQVAVTAVVAQVCGLDREAIHVGVDGCSAPIHYFRVRPMALGYARLAVPHRHFDASTASAADRLARAMWHGPAGHTGEPPYAEVLTGGVRLLTKAGGGGVYCAGVIGRGLGFAMKVEDGASAPLRPIFFEVMRRLGIFSEAEAALLRDRFWPRVENRRGQIVGDVEVLI